MHFKGLGWLAIDMVRALTPRLRAARGPVRLLHSGPLSLFPLLTSSLDATWLLTEVAQVTERKTGTNHRHTATSTTERGFATREQSHSDAQAKLLLDVIGLRLQVLLLLYRALHPRAMLYAVLKDKSCSAKRRCWMWASRRPDTNLSRSITSKDSMVELLYSRVVGPVSQSYNLRPASGVSRCGN